MTEAFREEEIRERLRSASDVVIRFYLGLESKSWLQPVEKAYLKAAKAELERRS